MSKQEEIREGMAEVYWQSVCGCYPSKLWDIAYADLPEEVRQQQRSCANLILSYLHSQGVVIIDPEDPYTVLPLIEE